MKKSEKNLVQCSSIENNFLECNSSSVEQTYFVYETIFGNMVIVSDGSAVTAAFIENFKTPSGKKAADKITDRAAKQLEEYSAGKRRQFDLPLRPSGTPFQQTVLNGLISIPYGETRSYKQVAQLVGCPDGSRAVGLANNKNPIVIIIPCHRVIGSDGSLTGYAYGLEMKKQLIGLEEKFKGV